MSILYRDIAVATFDSEWRAIHDTIFNGRPAHEQPFLHSSWGKFLIPYGLNMELEVFNSLACAATQIGDKDIVVWNSEALEPQPAASMAWDYHAADQLRCTLLGHFETHIFGHSGSWGMVCTVNDFSCVGGESSFMEAVAASLGGRGAVREQFLRFATREWEVSDEFRTKVLKMVGWE